VADFQKFRLGILGSGKGSILSRLPMQLQQGKIPAEIAIVLSDVENAGILSHARERKNSAQFIPPGKFRTKLDEEAEREFVKVLREAKVDLIVLAGFMRVLKGEFLRAFEGRIVNIHPSLLPSFPGLEAWKQALDHGVKVTGCTVHFVDAGVDAGPIIAQQTVSVFENETPESLHQRIHAAEHELYPKCVAAIARGRNFYCGKKSGLEKIVKVKLQFLFTLLLACVAAGCFTNKERIVFSDESTTRQAGTNADEQEIKIWPARRAVCRTPPSKRWPRRATTSP
jgi:phosphoribosylglycinamide formyltransferase-1